mgnify:FL=1|jgi:hypothetical protein
MEEERKQERSFELRSEKVRSIVGQVPSFLVRYGIIIIGLVLFVIAGGFYFLPYKKLYAGTAVVSPLKTHISSDSIDAVILLKFNGQALGGENNQPIHLSNGMVNVEGVLLSVSSIRDTLGRHKSQVRFNRKDYVEVENQTLDFRTVYVCGNVLSMIFKTACLGVDK